MKKKQLFICVGLLGFIITSLFLSPIESRAEQNTEESGIQALSNTKDFGGARALYVDSIDCGALYEEISVDGGSRWGLGVKVASSKLTAGLYNFQTTFWPIVNGNNGDTTLEVRFVKPGTNTSITAYDYNEITGLEGVSLVPGYWYIGEAFDLIVYSTDDHTQPFDQWDAEKYEIKDVKAPTIGGTVNLSVNVDSQPSIDEILSHVVAHDETDGYVPVVLTSSTYVQGEMAVGTYTINFTASDKSGNSASGAVTVYRFDGTIPTLTTSQAEYVVNYDNTLSLDSIKATLTVHDNVDNNCTILVENDTFTGHEHVVGDYSIQFRAKDASNNYSTVLNIPISVKNLGTPVITGPKTITLGTTEKLTLDIFKSKFSVVDGYDGTITDYTISGFDEYTTTSRKVGTNKITIEYTNSGGNKATFNVDIVKQDTIAPGIFYESYFILLKQGEVFTDEMIIAQAASVLNVDIAEVQSISGEYDTNTIGDYAISVLMVTGETENFILSVYGDEENKDTSSFDFKKFFSGEGYAENFFNYPNWKNWNFWIWFTYAMIAVLVIVVVYFKFFKKKKSFGKRR